MSFIISDESSTPIPKDEPRCVKCGFTTNSAKLLAMHQLYRCKQRAEEQRILAQSDDEFSSQLEEAATVDCKFTFY